MVHRKFLWKAAAVLMSYSLAAGSAAPVVHYDLNEGAGTVVRNRAGAAGKGRFRGPVAWAPALDGSGILLDGATNSVFCGPMPELDEEKGMTLLVWFKSTHPLGLRTVASAENPESGEGWRFGVDNNRLFSVLPPNEASSGWSDGLWHLGALVIRGREVREYMDGELVRSTSLEKPVRLNAGAELAIGSLSGRELGGFHGVIDDVKIYNVVLEADRIRQEFRRLVKAPQNNPELEFRRGMILRTLAPAAAQREQLSGRLSEKYRALASRLAAVPPAARGAELEQSTRQLDSLAAEARTLRNELDKERLRRLGKTSVRTSFWGNRTAEVRLPLVWGVTALDNIFSDRLLPDGEPVNRIRLDACRNEYEPGQFVISSLDYRGPVRLKLNAPAHENDPAAKLTELTANFVKEIYASQNTVGFYRNPKSPLLRPAPATFPDMLSNDDTTMLEPGRSQPVWLTVRVPAGAKPGLYRGRVEVQTMFGVQPLEVEMRVYDVALPEVPIFRLGTWGSARLLANLAGFAEQPGFRDPRYWTLFEKVLRNMKEHRAYNFGDPPLWEIRNNIRITDDGKGGVEIDYSTFDRFPEMLDKVYGKGNWRVMSADIPLDAPLYGRDGKVKYNPFGRIQDLRKRYWNFDDPEFNAFAVKVLRNLVRHLTEKGWIGQFQFIYRDEPDPVMFANGKHVYKHLQKIAPELVYMNTLTHTGLIEGYPDVDIVVPAWTANEGMDAAIRNATAAGRRAIVYNNFSSYLDRSLLCTRTMGAILYNLGCEGFNQWSWAWSWDKRSNPYQDAFVDGYGPGEGYLVYFDPYTTEITSSMRWEQLRETAEDFDAFKLYEKLGGDPRRYTGRLGRDMVNFETDPQRFMEVRREFLADLEKLAAGRKN